ncbi:MAG: 3-hydroxyacyl-CoA dehydrogenase NAD-binding domain-containing protein [Syntrophobacteraceae bacterium]
MRTLQMEIDGAGTAVIRIDDEGDTLNKLSSVMISELEEVLREIERDRAIRSLLFISGKEDNFIVGVDIREFEEASDRTAMHESIHVIQGLFNRIERLPYPVIAAVNGPCLGGGMELALACRFRIATDHDRTLLGLPEVKLGLIPAAGGTQRLTRLLGAGRALPLILEGRALSAPHARSIGMVDLVVHPYDLLGTAKRCLPYFGQRMKTRQGTRRYPPFPSLDWVLRHLKPARKYYFAQAAKRIDAKAHGNYPALPEILRCVENETTCGLPCGLESEAEAFSRLVLSPESEALRSLFFATTAMKRKPSTPFARQVQRVGILGGGLMGAGIATVAARSGMPVIMRDVSLYNLSRGLKDIWTHLDRQRRRQKHNPVERDRIFSRVVPTTDYRDFSSADVVIEAVFEDLSLKRQVLQEIEEFVKPECIFASNTSAIPISRIASASRRPETVIGMHYFSPVPRMPLLEVAVTPRTAEWVRDTVVSLGRRLGKTVIVVQDGPGFYTTRILAAYLLEAATLLNELAEIHQVDRAMVQFGFPVGPFKLLDEVGIDVAAHASREIHELMADRDFSPPTGLHELLRNDFRGRKNERGFYRYAAHWWQDVGTVLKKSGERRAVNEEAYAYFGGKKREVLDEADIRDRLSLIMINEAIYCLQEGIVSNPADGDVGAVLGLGFPPFLGGPFRYLDRIGAAEATVRLERLAERFGKRFAPAPLLVDMAMKEESFYSG